MFQSSNSPAGRGSEGLPVRQQPQKIADKMPLTTSLCMTEKAP
jgi:hypothetical protein